MVEPSASPAIFVLSGGVGASGEQIVQTILAQFPDARVPVHVLGNIRHRDQVSGALQEARQVNGLVVYTLVDETLSRYLEEEARAMGVKTIDLMGPMISWVSAAIGQTPLQEPGRYRLLHREHYGRFAAIDYTLNHDDGKNQDGWPQAEIMLVGVSRAGKTPLSVYLAVLGWKVANYPLVPELPVPPALFELDPKRVFGLTVDPEQLMVYRRQRQARLGVSESSNYTDLESIQQELQQARRIFRDGNFQVVSMTDKTIEQGADEILRKLVGESSSSLS